VAESSVRGESGYGGQGTLCVQVKDAFKFKLSLCSLYLAMRGISFFSLHHGSPGHSESLLSAQSMCEQTFMYFVGLGAYFRSLVVGASRLEEMGSYEFL